MFLLKTPRKEEPSTTSITQEAGSQMESWPGDTNSRARPSTLLRTANERGGRPQDASLHTQPSRLPPPAHARGQHTHANFDSNAPAHGIGLYLHGDHPTVAVFDSLELENERGLRFTAPKHGQPLTKAQLTY